jgi:hypothetical protein
MLTNDPVIRVLNIDEPGMMARIRNFAAKFGLADR